jgi:hypothetical protein
MRGSDTSRARKTTRCGYDVLRAPRNDDERLLDTVHVDERGTELQGIDAGGHVTWTVGYWEVSHEKRARRRYDLMQERLQVEVARARRKAELRR